MKLNIGEKTTNYVEQVKISISNGTIEGHDKDSGDMNEKDMQQLEKQVHYKEMYQPRDILDSELENMRMLMVKASQKRHEEKRNIYISRERSSKRQVTEEDYKSEASGALQQKVWKLGQLRMTKSKYMMKLMTSYNTKFGIEAY